MADTTVEAVEEATAVVVAETRTTEAVAATVAVEVKVGLILAISSSPTTEVLLREATDTTRVTAV